MLQPTWMFLVKADTATEVQAALEFMGYTVTLACDPKDSLLPMLDLIAQGPAAAQPAHEAARETKPVAC